MNCKTKTILSMLVVAFAVVSCGGASHGNITMTAEDCEYAVTVGSWGDVDDFFDIVPGTYTVKKKDGSLMLDVDVVINKKEKKLSSYTPVELSCDLDISDDTDVIFKSTDMYSAYSSLSAAKVGDKVRLSFSYVDIKDILKSILSQISGESKIVDIFLDLEEKDERDEWDERDDEEDDDNRRVRAKSSTSDWNSVLDEYGEFVDKYISFYKKAMAGDLSAMGEYAKMLKSAEELSDKISDAEDDLSTVQLERYLKLVEKMSSALLQ